MNCKAKSKTKKVKSRNHETKTIISGISKSVVNLIEERIKTMETSHKILFERSKQDVFPDIIPDTFSSNVYFV